MFYGSFYRYCVQQHFVVCARKMRKKPQPSRTGNFSHAPVALVHRVYTATTATSDPTSELVIIYAVFGPGKQPS